jgi:hypothetical protein
MISNSNYPAAAPLETIGLLGFAVTTMSPPTVHWTAPMFFAMLIAIANVRPPHTPLRRA